MRHIRRFNIFDIIIILACAGLAYGAYLFSLPQQAVAQDGSLIQFTIEFSNREAGFHQLIEPGPIMTESTHGLVIGNVVRAYALPFLVDVSDEDNDIVRRTPVEGREFTYVVVETWANISDFEIAVNQVRIVVNRDIYVRSRDVAGRGFITNIEIMN